MAVDAYAMFTPYNGKWTGSESQTDWSRNKETLASDFAAATNMSFSGDTPTYGQIFELEDYSFDIEQTLNIGSQSGGSGAGKITFNPFSITRKIDAASPGFFQNACTGTPFKLVSLALRKSTGAGAAAENSSGQVFARFDFKLVAVKTISWAHDDESPKETVTFEYGAVVIRYSTQAPSGALAAPLTGGWNRVKNVSDWSLTDISAAKVS